MVMLSRLRRVGESCQDLDDLRMPGERRRQPLRAAPPDPRSEKTRPDPYNGRAMVRISAAALVLGVIAPFLLQGQLKEREQDPLELPANMRDEDEDIISGPTYAFNPIQAKKEVKVGNFYARKGSHRAAAARYLEATRWNPSYAEAFWKLGQAREELGQNQQALDAYQSFLKLEADGKRAREIRSRLSELEKRAKDASDEPDSPKLPSTASLPPALRNR